MSKRLQVLLEAKEYKSFQQLAKEAGLSLGEWVRQTLRQTSQRFSKKNPQKKLEQIRKAGKHHNPAGEVEDILKEIEKGYLDS